MIGDGKVECRRHTIQNILGGFSAVQNPRCMASLLEGTRNKVVNESMQSTPAALVLMAKCLVKFVNFSLGCLGAGFIVQRLRTLFRYFRGDFQALFRSPGSIKLNCFKGIFLETSR